MTSYFDWGEGGVGGGAVLGGLARSEEALFKIVSTILPYTMGTIGCSLAADLSATV